MLLKMRQFMSGGQIFDYKTKMMLQVLRRIFGWTLLGFMLLVGGIIFTLSFQSMKVLGMQAWCILLTKFGYGDALVWNSGAKGSFTAHWFLHSSALQEAVHQASAAVIKTATIALVVGGVCYTSLFALVARFFIKKGEKYTKDKHISGTRLAKNPQEVITSVKKSARGISQIYLFNQLPMPARSEFQGIFFHGSTGSGKTQAMMRLLDEIRRLGEPAIIYDKECTIKPYFFNAETDVELNPVSELCANWDLWAECDNPMEFGNLATYLIPKSAQGSDPFWVDAARTILTSMAWRMRNHEDKSAISLLRHLLTTTLDEMRNLLKGTESENLVSKEIEKTAISIKSVLATYTKALRFLEGLDGSGKPTFSIKGWIKDATSEETKNKNGWLFITSRSKYHREIKPLISLWLGLAMQGIQSLKPNSNTRIWLVMDELASLHRLEMLSDTLADIRKFGGCVAVGIQSISQLEFLYGNQEAHAITDLLNTSIYFRSPKSRVAKWVSEDLGEQVIEEVRESQSYGPNAMRDGNTIGNQRVVRKTVDSGTVMTMEDLSCFVRLIGDHPIAQLTMPYLERLAKMEPLEERVIDFDALEKINQEALSLQNNPEVNAAVKKQFALDELADRVADDENVLDTIKAHKVTGIDALENKMSYGESLF
jgi:type IV conjugative transfer system coupling protein TraD